MFFYKKLYILSNKKNTLKPIFINNIFSWHKKNLIWQFFFSGLYFDDIFSKFIKLIFNKFFNISSFLILDKWLSYWTGAGFFKNNLKNFNKIFYIEKVNFYFFLSTLIIAIPLAFYIVFIIIIFLI